MLLPVLLLASACSSGSAKAGLGPSENLAPSIVSLDLQVAQRVHGTDEAAVIRAKGRLSNGGQINQPTEWEALDGGTVTSLGDGSIALFSSDEKGPKRIVGRGKGNGNGNGNGNGGGGGEVSTSGPIIDTVTVVVDELESPIDSIWISPNEAVIPVNTTYTIFAHAMRADGSYATPIDAKWNSSGVGSVDGSLGGVPCAGPVCEFVAGPSKGTGSTQVLQEVGSAGEILNDIMPFQVVDAWLLEDFSRYESTADLMGNGYGVFSNADNLNTSRISLDTQGGFGGSSRSMRYDFPSRANDSNKCHDYSIGRTAKLPTEIRPGGEVWIEVAAKFSSNFETVASGCTGISNPGYKFIFLTVYPSSRFQLGNGYHGAGTQWSAYYPGGVDAGSNFSFEFGNLHDGQWHVYRFYAKLSTSTTSNDGAYTIWVDGAKVVDFRNVSMKGNSGEAITSIYGVALGKNINQGPDQPQSVWWGRVAAWRTNPGW